MGVWKKKVSRMEIREIRLRLMYQAGRGVSLLAVLLLTVASQMARVANKLQDWAERR